MHTICNQLAHLSTTSTCNLFAYNLQSTCSFVNYFNLQSTCVQFAINLLFVNYFNLQSICIQFAINLLICKLNSTRDLLAYNFRSTCTQSTINLLLANLQFQLAYKLPAILQFVCSLPTSSTGIQMPAICNSFALCLQFQLTFQLPTIYNQLALSKSTISTGI